MNEQNNQQEFYPGRLIENPTGELTECQLLVGLVELNLRFPSAALKHHGLVQYDCFNLSANYENGNITHEHITPTERYSDLLKEIEDWDPSEIARLTRDIK